MAEEPLKQSPLHARHEGLGAKFAEFGGWSMPVEYAAGVVKEHTAVREAVGIFDVSHLGKLIVSGPGAAELVNRTLSNDLAKVSPGQAQYTLCCAADGGIVDDLIVYLDNDERLLLVPNAANSAEVARRLREAAPESVTVADHHDSYAIIAVQGTASDEILAAIGLPVDLDYMSFVESDWSHGSGLEVGVVVCRTGYTGERGYEIVVANDAAGALWDALLEQGEQFGVLPCGLGSRDTLRTEMGYPLHGQDITPETNPVDAGIGWAVGWRKPEFWGRDALLAAKEEGRRRRLTGIVATGRGIPRPGMPVSLTEHVPLGDVTSGTFSPTLRKGIGLVYVPAGVDDGVEVGVDVRGRREVFTLVRPPFVETSVKED
jgi:aminomethyltransferase